MLLALVVLAGFVLLYFFAFNEEMQGGGKSIESIIALQTREVADLKNQIHGLGDVPALLVKAKALNGIKQQNQSRESQIANLKQNLVTANESIALTTKEFETYKDQYRALVRGQAKGQILEKLETLKGTVYENVTLREVTAIGAQIRHDGGIKRIPYEELPVAMQDRFQFDPKQKAEALAKENAMQDQHEAAMSAAASTATGQAAERKEEDTEAIKKKNARILAMKETQIQLLKEEIKGLNKAIQKEYLKTISRAPQMRIQLATKQRMHDELCTEVANMRAER